MRNMNRYLLVFEQLKSAIEAFTTALTQVFHSYRDNSNFSGMLSQNYQEILVKYYQLARCPELSEKEQDQLDEILQLAQSDARLSLLINEIDELTFQELGFWEHDYLDSVEKQKSQLKALIENEFNIPGTSVLGLDVEDLNVLEIYRPDLICSDRESLDYQHILAEYYRLTTLPELSEFEAERLEQILELAEHADLLSLLISEIDERTFQELGFTDSNACQYQLQKIREHLLIESRLNNLEHIEDLEPVNLSQWFENVFEKGWKRSEAPFLQPVRRRRFKQRLSRVTGTKQIDSQLASYPLDLVLTLTEKPAQRVRLEIQGRSRNREKLPSGLKLIVIDESEEIFSEVSTETNHNNFRKEDSKISSRGELREQSPLIDEQVIQVPPFSGRLQEMFALKVVLGGNIFTEYFVI